MSSLVSSLVVACRHLSSQIEQLIEALKTQILQKGQEIADYVDKNQIRVRAPDAPSPGDPSVGHAPSASVLVSNDQ